MSWTEETAREWYAGTFLSELGISLRMLTAFNRRSLDWHEGRELPPLYADLPSHPHECVRDALRAVERFAELRPALGYSFREGIAQGIRHAATIAPDGGIVDPAVARLGPPSGYLLVELRPDELRFLEAQTFNRTS